MACTSRCRIATRSCRPIRSSSARARNRIAAIADELEANGQQVHVIGGARLAGELDAKRAINEGAIVGNRHLRKSQGYGDTHRRSRKEKRWDGSEVQDFLQRRPANFRPMTPMQFLRRAADVFPDRHGGHSRRVSDTPGATTTGVAGCSLPRCRRSGVGTGEIVAVLSPEHAGHAGGAFRRSDVGRSAQCTQHAPRCRGHRLHPRAFRDARRSSSTGNGAMWPRMRCRT